MIDQNHRHLTTEQARLLRHLRPERVLSRAAFHGRPFRLEDTPHTFPEELVLGLVDDGLLRVTQQTTGWAKYAPCAFTVRLATDGEKIRAGIITGARQPETGNAA